MFTLWFQRKNRCRGRHYEFFLRRGLKNFTEKDVIPVLESLEKQQTNINFEIWALNYHMNTQRSETMLMTPDERRYWIDQLIKQREKESEEIKKYSK